jgi:hypothetical protein
LDAYFSSTAYAQLEHMSIASGRLQFTIIIHEAGALTLLNFLIHGQSSESLTQSGRLAAAVKQQKRSPCDGGNQDKHFGSSSDREQLTMYRQSWRLGQQAGTFSCTRNAKPISNRLSKGFSPQPSFLTSNIPNMPASYVRHCSRNRHGYSKAGIMSFQCWPRYFVSQGLKA